FDVAALDDRDDGAAAIDASGRPRWHHRHQAGRSSLSSRAMTKGYHRGARTAVGVSWQTPVSRYARDASISDRARAPRRLRDSWRRRDAQQLTNRRMPVWSKNPIPMKSKDDDSRGPDGPDGGVTLCYITKKSPRNTAPSSSSMGCSSPQPRLPHR